MFTPKGYSIEIHQEKDEGDNFKEDFGFELNDLLINFIEPTYIIKVLVPNPYYNNY